VKRSSLARRRVGQNISRTVSLSSHVRTVATMENPSVRRRRVGQKFSTTDRSNLLSHTRMTVLVKKSLPVSKRTIGRRISKSARSNLVNPFNYAGAIELSRASPPIATKA
jgi:hypothetical protein